MNLDSSADKGGTTSAHRLSLADLARTALGSVEGWPALLRWSVDLVLHSDQPMALLWGAQLLAVFNDRVLGYLAPETTSGDGPASTLLSAQGRPADQWWPAVWPAIADAVLSAVKHGVPARKERVEIRQPGTLQRPGVFVTFAISPIVQKDQSPAGVMIIITDETARVQIEDECQQLLGQRQLALDAARMGWWHYDPVTQIASFDQRYTEIFGVSGHKRANEEILKRLHPDDLPAVWAKVEAALDVQNPHPYSAQYRIVLDDRSIRWVEAHGSAMFEGTGPHRRAVSLVGTVADITHRRQAEAQSESALSDRVRSEQQLRESNQLLQAISDSTGDIIYAKDLEGRMRFANQATVALVGKPLEQIIGKTDAEFLEDKAAARVVMENDRRVLTTGQAVDVEEVVPLADGTHRVWLSRKAAHRDSQGRIVGLLGVSRDVTESRSARQAAIELAEKYERQSRLFERVASATPDFIYVFDLTGRFIYANRRLLEVWGKTFEQAAGKSLIELGYPQWHAEMHLREIEQVIRTRMPIRGEVPFTGGSGISGVYEYIFTPVPGPDGSVEVVAGTTRDITERRQTEERISRDALLLANVQDSVVVTDLDGIVTFWNEGATRLFGWSAPEMLGKPYTHRLPEHARAEVADWIKTIASGQNEFSGQWLDYRRDGSRVWIEATTRLARDSTGKLVGIMGVSHDISERKQTEVQREQLLISERAARSQAERAGQVKDEFLATLSHELRTPLNAILGWAAILNGVNVSEADVRDGLETIERNARAQSQIIEDLLDMSRIISGKIRLDVQRLELTGVVQAALDTVRPAADAKGVRLRSMLNPNAGPISGDPNRLQQVFWNLLTNAVKFTPRSGQVQVVLQRVNSSLEVTVADTGEGISPDFLPFVFDRFRQADASTTRRHGGLGLGLSIVKQLVELHGGSVRVTSPGAGQGTTFTVTLPLLVAHADPLLNPDDGRHPSAALSGALKDSPDCPRLDGVLIVVVDDEPDTRSLIRRLLENCDALVRVAATSDEAIRLILEQKPDVLISDIGMPVEDGYALIRRVRALPPDQGGQIPAIALTAYARTEDRVRSIRAGFQSHVAKPVEPLELITVVASLAGK